MYLKLKYLLWSHIVKSSVCVKRQPLPFSLVLTTTLLCKTLQAISVKVQPLKLQTTMNHFELAIELSAKGFHDCGVKVGSDGPQTDYTTAAKRQAAVDYKWFWCSHKIVLYPFKAQFLERFLLMKVNYWVCSCINRLHNSSSIILVRLWTLNHSWI